MPIPFANIFTQQKPAPQTPAPTTPATPAPAAAKLENQQPSIEPVQTPGTEANGIIPNNVPEPEKTPLDQFNTLWDTNPDAPAPAGEFKPEALDPTKLQEVMSKVNLTGAITPELQARINAGGEDAMAAMLEIVNTTGQTAMVHSATVANKMLESNSTKLMAALEAKIPGLVKAQGVNSALTEKNPIFSNPAVKPFMDATQAQLQLKNPDATPAEITAMTQEYVLAVGQAFNPAPAEKLPDAGDDWSKFEFE